MSNQKLADAFYMAAWDLSEQVACLPEYLHEDMPAYDVRDVEEIFKAAALPFLDLTGQDIPVSLHDDFDHVDRVVRQEIFPALEVLTEEWDVLREKVENGVFEGRDGEVFAEKCTYICNKLELEVILQASNLEKRMLSLT